MAVQARLAKGNTKLKTDSRILTVAFLGQLQKNGFEILFCPSELTNIERNLEIDCAAIFALPQPALRYYCPLGGWGEEGSERMSVWVPVGTEDKSLVLFSF